MAGALGIEDVIFGTNADGGNSHAAAARQGIPAILVETGQLGERDPDTAPAARRRPVRRSCAGSASWTPNGPRSPRPSANGSGPAASPPRPPASGTRSSPPATT